MSSKYGSSDRITFINLFGMNPTQDSMAVDFENVPQNLGVWSHRTRWMWNDLTENIKSLSNWIGRLILFLYDTWEMGETLQFFTKICFVCILTRLTAIF